METNSEQVVDLRRGRRFNAIRPFEAEFAGSGVHVMNLSAEGIQIRHPAFMKIGTRSSLRVENPESRESMVFPAHVLWSRLSTVADASGKYLYLSGLLIEEAAAVAGPLGRLIRATARADADSMERKRKALEERAQRRAAIVAAPPSGNELRISRDQLLLIKEAREKFESNPDAVKEWYSRAKVLAEKHDEGRPLPYRRDVLAIWGYLGGHVDIDQVALVYELTNPQRQSVRA